MDRYDDSQDFSLDLRVPNTPTHLSRPWRFFLIIVATVESLLTAGVIFGWSGLELVLQKQHVYAELCHTPLTNTTLAPGVMCELQKERFDLIYTVATTVFALSVWPTGAILDKLGPRFSCALGSMLFGCGVFLFAISNSKTFDAFLPGFCLIAVGGPPIVFSFMHLSNLFPSQRATIITLYNVMLDASCLDLPIMGLLYDATGWSYRVMFLAYLIVPAVVGVTGLYLWPMRAFEADPAEEPASTTTADGSVQAPVARLLGTDMTSWSFTHQLSTAAFVLLLIYNCFQLFRVNFYLGTVNYQVEHLVGGVGNGTQAIAEWYDKAFELILPLGGIASVPLVGYFLDYQGLIVSMFALNISATVFGLFTCIPMLRVQVISFGLIAFWRAFHFSAMSTYVALLFGFSNFGKLWGLAFCISGVINLGVFFVDEEISKVLAGNFFIPNAIQTIISGLLFVFPLWLLYKSRSAAGQGYAPVGRAGESVFENEDDMILLSKRELSELVKKEVDGRFVELARVDSQNPKQRLLM